MKKLISLLVLAILTLGIIGCDFEVGITNREKSNISKINESIKISGVEKIKISIEVGKLNIEKYDGDELKIKGDLKKKCKKYSIKDEDGTIDVKIKTYNKYVKFSSNQEPEVTVLIPEKYTEDLYISTGVGESEIKDVVAKNIEVKAGAGDLTISNIGFKNLKFSAGVGQSNINLGKNTGDIEIKGGVGEIDMKLEEVNGNLSCSCGIGQTRIKIPENAPVKFNEKSGLGDCNITAVTSGEDLFEYDLKVGVGEIEVYN